MSIRKTHIAIPDTLRTFANNSDKYKLTESIFITPTDFTFTESEFIDNDFWYDNLGVNIFPLHGITAFAPSDVAAKFEESIQDFKYKIDNGKYKQKIKYDWSLDYHQLINELSGQDLRIIYVSGNVLRAVKDGLEIKGFKTSQFELEKIMFTLGNSTGNSELSIELLDPDELNTLGHEVEVDWQPKKMDRLVLSIDLIFTEDTITLSIKHLNTNITGIVSSDITITDNINGNITFTTFVPGDGIYILEGFSDVITVATLTIKSTIYIGCKEVIYKVVAFVVDNMIFADSNNAIFADGNNVITAKN